MTGSSSVTDMEQPIQTKGYFRMNDHARSTPLRDSARETGSGIGPDTYGTPYRKEILSEGRCEVRISPLVLEDIPAVEEIEREIYSLPWSARAFEDALERDYYLFLKAEIGGVLAGYCGYQRSFEIADITNVTVRREFWRRKVARQMLEILMEEGRRQGVERFTLEVRRSNEPAIALYHSLGFHEEGVRKGYYESPREDALILWTQYPADACRNESEKQINQKDE